jgi:NAD-dependent deacetylase
MANAASNHDPAGVAEVLRGARRVVVLTGAGVSAESGVPTFREAQTGHWSKFRPEDLATPEAFRRNPKLVWDWYAARRAQLQEVKPNPGHHALAELEGRVPEFLLATQNVDGLHARAGSKRLLELHGNITRTKCSSEGVLIDTWTQTDETPPRCPQCGDWLRPDVVWFNEMLPAGVFEKCVEASARCDLFLCVGTSSVVYPAAALPLLTARAHHFLPGPSGVILPQLVRAAWP